MTTRNAKTRYVATCGVSWRVGAREVNREAGDDISDAPADVLKEFLAWPPEAPAAVMASGATEAAAAMRELAASSMALADAGVAIDAAMGDLANAIEEANDG